MFVRFATFNLVYLCDGPQGRVCPQPLGTCSTAPSMVRWEVSYEGKSFQTKLEILSGPKFRQMPQIGQGGPPRHPKNQKKNGPKRALGPNLGPWALVALGPCSEHGSTGARAQVLRYSTVPDFGWNTMSLNTFFRPQLATIILASALTLFGGH